MLEGSTARDEWAGVTIMHSELAGEDRSAAEATSHDRGLNPNLWAKEQKGKKSSLRVRAGTCFDGRCAPPTSGALAGDGGGGPVGVGVPGGSRGSGSTPGDAPVLPGCSDARLL